MDVFRRATNFFSGHHHNKESGRRSDAIGASIWATNNNGARGAREEGSTISAEDKHAEHVHIDAKKEEGMTEAYNRDAGQLIL